MRRELVQVSILALSVLIFIIYFLISSTFHGIQRSEYIDYPILSETKTVVKPPTILDQALKTFSFAYNTTHLWSMRLADANYYKTARHIPCRSVIYVGGPQNETMDFCDESVIKEFSVESSIHVQEWLYKHQNPANCSDKKIAVIHKFAWSGFGSTVHQVVWALGVALGEGRIAVYETPGDWLYGNCKLGTPDCIFLPLSNCSVPSTIDGNRVTRITADFGHWGNPILPPEFRSRSFNWFRSQLLFYVMRYNPKTLASVQSKIARYFNPPTIELHRPYISVYVRRSDKIQSREMAKAYTLQQYFDLFDADVKQAKISTVYLNSEDGHVFNEFIELNKKKENYYKLLSINTTRDVVFLSLISLPMEQRGEIVLEFLTDLFIEINADIQVGTLTSNWCRIVDEMRFALGKIIPYYTPENRYLVDM